MVNRTTSGKENGNAGRSLHGSPKRLCFFRAQLLPLETMDKKFSRDGRAPRSLVVGEAAEVAPAGFRHLARCRAIGSDAREPARQFQFASARHQKKPGRERREGSKAGRRPVPAGKSLQEFPSTG